MKIFGAIFWENENLKFFLMWTTFNFGDRSKTKKYAEDICRGTLGIKCERDRPVGLGAKLGDGLKIKNNFSSFRDFSGESRKCHIVGRPIYYKPRKFNQNRWRQFWEYQKFKFFLMWTTLNFEDRLKTKKRDWPVGLGTTLGDGQKIKKNYFSSFRDFSGKSR